MSTAFSVRVGTRAWAARPRGLDETVGRTVPIRVKKGSIVLTHQCFEDQEPGSQCPPVAEQIPCLERAPRGLATHRSTKRGFSSNTCCTPRDSSTLKRAALLGQRHCCPEHLHHLTNRRSAIQLPHPLRLSRHGYHNEERQRKGPPLSSRRRRDRCPLSV